MGREDSAYRARTATAARPADEDTARRSRARKGAAAVAGAVLVLSIALMVANGPAEGEAGTRTDNTTVEVDEDGAVTKKTTSSEVTTPGLDTSLLGRTLDTGASPLLIQLLVAGLAAFAAGAVVQRVWLGEYGITVGPFSLPVLPPVSEESAKTAVELITESPEFAEFRSLEPGSRGPAPIPQFIDITDERLAIVSIRLELEQRLRRLARAAHLDGEIGANRLPDRLIGAGVLEPGIGTGLRKLLDIGDRVVNGADIEASAVQKIRDDAIDVLYMLSELTRRVRGQGGQP